MKVKDIINTLINFGDNKVNFIVKPQGTKIEYYNNETKNLQDEVAEMEVDRWFICGAKKNYCKFVIIVEQNEEYEAKRKKAWEDLISK